jgi:O-antigen/teichoic acid export membrane protein
VTTGQGSGAAPSHVGSIESSAPENVIAGHLRGSSLMLVGRIAAMGVAFATQVLVVRHLSKDDYGVFAFALSAALVLQTVLPLGLDRADTRFLALYDHRQDNGRLLGVIALEAATVLSLGGLAVGCALVLQGPLQGSFASAGTAFGVLLVMLALAPLQALDVLVVNVFAVFASPWMVFFRRYVLEPGLRLLVAVALVVFDGGLVFLTVGYVGAALVGVGLYAVMLVRLLSRLGILVRGSLRAVVVPVREVLGFSLPLLLTSMVAVASTEMGALVLGVYGSATDVAAFRAVQPFAALNLVVMISFTTLFTPAAARLFARGDMEGLRMLYWQSACWVAVLTFPVICTMTALSHDFTVTAIGERYADSAPYLALLSFGYYVNAALGFNGLTVQMLGRLRYMMLMNVAVLAWMIAANLLLVPTWGAKGAVIAVLSTLVVHNVGKQAGLGFGAEIGVVNRRHAVVIGKLALAGVSVNVAMSILHPPLMVGLVLIGAVSALIFRVLGPALELRSTFPELGKFRVLRWIVR